MCASAVWTATVAVPTTAGAHPMGMSSVSRYVGVQLHANAVECDYLVDFAELPAWREIELLDANHDDRVTPDEQAAYLAPLVERVRASLDVRVDGVRVSLRARPASLEAPPGQNGMSTLRIAVEFRAVLEPADDRVRIVSIHDALFADRPGWRELGATSSEDFTVRTASVGPDGPRAGATLAYPAGAEGTAPLLRQDDATFAFAPGARPSTRVAPTGTPRSPIGDASGRRLAAVLRAVDRSWHFVLFALGLAFGLGAGHALSPGHGKSLVAAWIVGSRARPRDAVVLGVSLAFAHTLSVFALALLLLPIEERLGSDKVLRAIELGSGALVMAVAVSQLPERWRRWRSPTLPAEPTDSPQAVPPTRSMIALGFSGGVVPCPGALVVLLTAIAVHRLAFGIALLGAFSLGLASVLTALGVGVALAGRSRAATRVPVGVVRAAPVVSAVAVTLLGLLLVVRALAR